MIITRRASAVRYSTDPIAAGLSTFVAPCAARDARCEARAHVGAPLDLARLYPNVFGQAPHAAGQRRSARALTAAIVGFTPAK